MSSAQEEYKSMAVVSPVTCKLHCNSQICKRTTLPFLTMKTTSTKYNINKTVLISVLTEDGQNWPKDKY